MGKDNMINVLYVVGNTAPTSVALEVAHHIGGKNIQLRVASFYETDYQASKLQVALTKIDAVSRYDLCGALKLFRCIVEFQPDVIHVHHTVSAFWAALFGRLMGAKIVRSEHNNSQFRTTAQRAVNTVSRMLSNRVLCNSENTHRSLSALQKWLLGDRCRVIYNGINATQIQETSCPPPFEEKVSSTVTVGSVGRLIPQKNYERLLQAFSRVLTKFEGDVRLVLVGDGKKRPQIEQEIRRLKLGEHVTLTGEVKREKVYAALHAFDIFVMPSLWEGFCNAAVEAMVAGLPLLCSDIPTLREVVGDVAVYANPNKSSSMSESLLKLLEEGREKREERGRQARLVAAEKYSIEKTAREYVKCYTEIKFPNS